MGQDIRKEYQNLDLHCPADEYWAIVFSLQRIAFQVTETSQAQTWLAPCDREIPHGGATGPLSATRPHEGICVDLWNIHYGTYSDKVSYEGRELSQPRTDQEAAMAAFGLSDWVRCRLESLPHSRYLRMKATLEESTTSQWLPGGCKEN